MRFVMGLSSRVDELVLFGRLDPSPGRTHYVVPDSVRFVPLPHYPRVTALGAQARALRGTHAVFARELDQLDAVWIFGPHPIALVLAATARRRGTPLFLGVRQEYRQYIAGRLPSRKWLWAVAVAEVLERSFRALSRSAPTVAVGETLAAAYSSGQAPVLSTGFSLVSAADLIEPPQARIDWGEKWQILSVGRLDPEKNPLLLVDVLQRLRRRDSRWCMTVAGDGALAAELARRAAAAGLFDAIDLVGYVAQGEALRSLYGRHDVFLHVSLTEGLPQVLIEAQAAGVPVVATAVGGVASAVGVDGSALLVPPRDADAAADALTRISRDPSLRRQLIERGLANARSQTTEAQLDRIVAFFAAELDRRRAS
ncbi:MAG: glycosyltransferase [Actinomycetota bacterium]|nr:glycosyltransferase [Actinomycetota bacterium]